MSAPRTLSMARSSPCSSAERGRLETEGQAVRDAPLPDLRATVRVERAQLDQASAPRSAAPRGAPRPAAWPRPRPRRDHDRPVARLTARWPGRRRWAGRTGRAARGAAPPRAAARAGPRPRRPSGGPPPATRTNGRPRPRSVPRGPDAGGGAAHSVPRRGRSAAGSRARRAAPPAVPRRSATSHSRSTEPG